MRKHLNNKTDRARSLRATETKSERLLWSILRAKQLCDLKFRRQHPIGPFFADFACIERRLVIEIDGGYHEEVGKSDLQREEYLIQCGWEVIRFTDKEVEQDADARAIAKHLRLTYEFRQRNADGSGMKNSTAPNKRLR